MDKSFISFYELLIDDFFALDLSRKLVEMLKGNKRLDAYLQCIAKDIKYEYCNSKHKKCKKKKNTERHHDYYQIKLNVKIIRIDAYLKSELKCNAELI